MYNSVLINFLAKIWLNIEKVYKHSLLAKIIEKLGKAKNYLFQSSKIKFLITEDTEVIESSLSYKLFKKFIKSLNKIFIKLNKNLRKVASESIIWRSKERIIKEKEGFYKSLIILSLTFLTSILVINLVKENFQYIILIIPIILLVLIFKGINKIIVGVKNSKIYCFIRDLFILDEEGGNQWW